ncbi:hypothetical protein F5884DRAFT_247180 [Xylogone sp. PMI_703]|nr:hypothetical protein F5884DRAFT_247180 [Xylogone sp. PMI_703]
MAALPVSTESPEEIANFLKSSPRTPVYVVVYSSATGGSFWCGDCRRAEPLVNAKFTSAAPGTVKVVHAGQRDEWRSKDNIWRQEPFLVTALPTIIKTTSSGHLERLVEEDVYDQAKLDAFVKV